MKVVILAGGLGTRLSEETDKRPKPMVEIGGRPILWHIMKTYAAYGFTDFVICLGYKGYQIREYFANYFLHQSDVTIDLAANQIQYHNPQAESWKVTLVDTGEATMTGGRLKRVRHYIGEEDFCMTYGDGVGDVNITRLVKAHRESKKLATVTAVLPAGRFGVLKLEGCSVTQFEEKPAGDGAWINGGFFVLSPQVLDYIDGDSTVWEQHPLRKLAKDGQLNAYFHDGFWQPMDTYREKQLLENLWSQDQAPWKVWV